MKTLKIITVLIFISIMACKNQQKEEKSPNTAEESSVNATSTPKTYAEISMKEGGHWEGREYIDGTFKNVNSLKVPAEHTDHSWFIRYEGPGWESNKVGYRLYLDWRNAIDIFGKVTDKMVLSEIGQDGFDSYHEMNDWGMDILKAGQSLGIGSYGRYIDGKVSHFKEVDTTFAKVTNSDDNSSVMINYSGWKTTNEKIDLSANLSIRPDSRITKNILKPSKAIDGLCTGIVKFENIDLIKNESSNGSWSYIATYGEQTLVPDKLGMAIFYRLESVTSVTEGEFDHLIVFKPTIEPITYYFLGAWEKEKNGITTEEEFNSYLDEKLNELNSTNTL